MTVYFVVADAETGDIRYAARSSEPLATVLETWPLDGAVVVETPDLMRSTRAWRVVDGAVVAREP